MGVETVVGGISAGGSLLGGMFGSSAAKKQARTNAINAAIDAGNSAAMERINAQEAQRVARLNAEHVHAQAHSAKSSAKALAAAQGFVGDTGTSALINDKLTALANADALAMLVDGGRKYAAGNMNADNMIQTGVSRGSAIVQQGNLVADQAMVGGLTGFINGAAQTAAKALAPKATLGS